jgi:hypothetical protein
MQSLSWHCAPALEKVLVVNLETGFLASVYVLPLLLINSIAPSVKLRLSFAAGKCRYPVGHGCNTFNRQ